MCSKIVRVKLIKTDKLLLLLVYQETNGVPKGTRTGIHESLWVFRLLLLFISFKRFNTLKTVSFFHTSISVTLYVLTSPNIFKECSTACSNSTCCNNISQQLVHQGDNYGEEIYGY